MLKHLLPREKRAVGGGSGELLLDGGGTGKSPFYSKCSARWKSDGLDAAWTAVSSVMTSLL